MLCLTHQLLTGQRYRDNTNGGNTTIIEEPEEVSHWLLPPSLSLPLPLSLPPSLPLSLSPSLPLSLSPSLPLSLSPSLPLSLPPSPGKTGTYVTYECNMYVCILFTYMLHMY